MQPDGGARQAAVFPFPCQACALGRRLAGCLGRVRRRGPLAGLAELQGGLPELRYRRLAGSPGHVQRCGPLAGPGVHSLAELQSGLPPDYGHGPVGGNVGWTRESFILWAGVVACFLAALWGTFHLALLPAWLFIW